MLTKKNLVFNYFAFSFLSSVWTFPAKFDRSSGTFHIPNGGRRRTRFRIVLAICMVHAILLSGRTFEAGVVSRDLPLEFLAFGIMASVASSCLCVMGILVDQTLEIQVKLWTELLGRVNQAGRSSRRQNNKTWEELWICYMPFLAFSLVLIYPVAYSVNPNLPYLFHGNVPAMFKSTPILVLCCILDMILVTFYLSLSNYLVVFIMSFVRQMKLELQILKDKVTRFGIHPECDQPAKPVSQPIRLMEMEEDAKTETRVQVDSKSEISPGAKVEIVCEVKSKSKGAEQVRVGNAIQVRVGNEIQVEGINKQVKRGAVNEIHGRFGRNAKVGIFPPVREHDISVAEEIGVEVKRRKAGDNEAGANSAGKRVKKWVMKRAERWFVRKAEKWCVKHAKTWAGKTVEKWAVKRSGKWAVQKAAPWVMETDQERAEKRETDRVVKRDQEREVNLEMETVKVDMETQSSDSEELKTACTAIEFLRLLFHLFNLAFAEIIFLLKIIGLTAPIWGMFAAVRLAASHPDFAFFYGVISVVCIFTYIGMFNSAFHLTGQAEACKSLILLQSTTLLNRKQQSKAEWNEIRCRIAAIPKLAIYCGHFHILEQNSTPVFINFILNKLADLLLAF